MNIYNIGDHITTSPTTDAFACGDAVKCVRGNDAAQIGGHANSLSCAIVVNGSEIVAATTANFAIQE